MEPIKKIVDKREPIKSVPTISTILRDGRLIEMVYRPDDLKTEFIVWQDGKWSREQAVKIDPLHEIVPYSPTNNLIKNDVVLFPSEPEEYGS